MIPRLPLILAIIGALPFVGLSLAIYLHLTSYPVLLQQLLVNYAAIVLSFLGGIHWGLAVLSSHTSPRASSLILAESVLVSLLAWSILFISEPYLQILTFALLYSVAWAIDSLLHKHHIIPLWFFQIRGIVTPVVVVSMYVAYFNIL